jgi:hypothetical protein
MRYFIVLSLLVMQLLSACRGSGTTAFELEQGVQKGVTPSITPAGDKTGPVIKDITTTSKGFSIDCVPTSITVTANITDSVHTALWYRVGADQPYTSRNMDVSNRVYSATIKAVDLPLGTYGTLEFYITAEDTAGNKTQSPVDGSVQFLPCIAH